MKHCTYCGRLLEPHEENSHERFCVLNPENKCCETCKELRKGFCNTLGPLNRLKRDCEVWDGKTR